MATVKQTLFLALRGLEAFYGGSAGGGKSSALLMAALQFVEQPDYAAILFRKTYSDLALPGALIDRALEWMGCSDARWNQTQHRWTFPSGATLSFGCLETENDKYRYGSSEFQFVGFDELTTFTESQYRFLFSRLRKREGCQVPLRMRAASNPGGPGHDWVRQRFLIEGESTGRIFVPASLSDNPHVNQSEYLKSLNQLDAITRERLLSGNWEINEGGMFRREWFRVVEAGPKRASRIRYWDKAGTADGGAYTAGVLMAADDDAFFVDDVVRGQWSSGDRNKIMLQTTQADRAKYGQVTTWVEQEPGSGGKESAELTIRMLAGFPVYAERVTGSKEDRARPFAAQCQAGNVSLVNGPWVSNYLDEIAAFPAGRYKDQVDASSGAFNKLALAPQAVSPRAVSFRPAAIATWKPR